MKLIHKTNKTYLLFSIALFLLVGVTIYLVLTSIINEEVDEKLEANITRLVEQIKKEHRITQLSPIIEIQELNHPTSEITRKTDTLLYDSIENEVEFFREISSIKYINNTPYKIIVRKVQLEKHDYIISIGVSILFVLIILLLSMLFVFNKIAIRVWKPFYQNLELFKHFSINDSKGLRLKDSDIDEFEQLNKVFINLTSKVRSDYQLLKEFTENSSHESQTPIAIIQSNLEEIIQFSDLNEQQISCIKNAYKSVQHLSKLNQALLFLAKIDNQQFDNTQTIDVSATLKSLIEEYVEAIELKEIKLKEEISLNINCTGNIILVNTLLSNIIGNAIKHNVIKGHLSIVLNNRFIEISNTGESYSEAPKTLFNRFIKGDKTSESLGLGLSIVKKIIDLYNWNVEYDISENRHTIRVDF